MNGGRASTLFDTFCRPSGDVVGGVGGNADGDSSGGVGVNGDNGAYHPAALDCEVFFTDRSNGSSWYAAEKVAGLYKDAWKSAVDWVMPYVPLFPTSRLSNQLSVEASSANRVLRGEYGEEDDDEEEEDDISSKSNKWFLVVDQRARIVLPAELIVMRHISGVIRLPVSLPSAALKERALFIVNSNRLVGRIVNRIRDTDRFVHTVLLYQY